MRDVIYECPLRLFYGLLVIRPEKYNNVLPSNALQNMQGDPQSSEKSIACKRVSIKHAIMIYKLMKNDINLGLNLI